MKELLKVQNLRKTFKISAKQQKIERTKERIKVAVDNLSFTAYEGEVFGLLGPNGAGKTTTLRMMSALVKPDKGDVLVDGASVVKNPEEVRKKIGFLTSELKLEEFLRRIICLHFFQSCTAWIKRRRQPGSRACLINLELQSLLRLKLGIFLPE